MSINEIESDDFMEMPKMADVETDELPEEYMPKKPKVKQSELPVIKSVSMLKLPDNGGYAIATLLTQGRKVLRVEPGEPGAMETARHDLKIKLSELFLCADNLPGIEFDYFEIGDEKTPVKESNLPTVVSLGMIKVPSTGQYAILTLHSQGKRINKIEIDEPNLLEIVRETLKIRAVKLFYDLDAY